MEVKKICHIITVHQPFDDRIFHKECKSLVNAGYDVTLIAQYGRDKVIDGVKIVALPKPKNRLYRMLTLPLKAFWLALKQKADIYHFHDPELMPVGMLLKIFTRAKIIYDVHEDYKSKIMSKAYIPFSLRKSIAILFDVFEKQVSKKFDSIVVADSYVKSRFKHSNIYIIANFPKIVNVKKEKRNDKKFVCIYAGGLSKDRGILKIVEAFQYLNNIPVKVILLGNWEDDYLKNDVVNHPAVEYLGYKSWDDTIRNYALADIGLNILQPVPAYVYCVENSVKIFEYMMAGLPIVSSNFPGLKKIIVENNKCGICVDPLNQKEIAEAIKYLIEHPEEARQMGENGRKAVLEKYNWEKESKKLIRLYKKLLAKEEKRS